MSYSLSSTAQLVSRPKRLTNVVDWKLLALFLMNKNNADFSLGDYQVDEESLSILGFKRVEEVK